MFRWFKPKIFNSGYLPEHDGHKVFFMEAGNPHGLPVLVFHGGPGGQAKIHHTDAFCPCKHRVILFDQRGCGQSLPAGEMLNNNTQALLDDAERLLKYLKIDGKVIVRGASWGSTLALLFALRNPQRVESLLLSQVFLADSGNKKWLYDNSRIFYPDMIEKLNDANNIMGDLSKHYAEMINSGDYELQQRASCLYGSFERVAGSLEPHLDIHDVFPEQLTSDRIYINYEAQNFMLEDNYILNNAEKLQNIPTLMVHNRLDMVCPLEGAYKLHKKLPYSKLIIVPEIGHVGKLLRRTINREIKAFLLQYE